MAPVFRRVVAVLGAATFLASLALPPVHIHLDSDDDGDHDDHAGTIHAHWAGHSGVDGHVNLSEGHGRVLFLDQRATVSIPVFPQRAAQVAVVVPDVVPQSLLIDSRARPVTAEATRDGPTRHSFSLRAPPLLV